MGIAHYVAAAALLAAMVPWVTAGDSGDGIPTKIMVRVISRDAKLVGTKVGGARVTIRDVGTGEVLAEGLHQGDTGNTDLIVKQARQRGVPVFGSEGAAGFLATLSLARPTVIEITADGPLGNEESRQRASKTMLVVPGKDVLGDGVVLEIHGFTVQILEPAADAVLRAGEDLVIRAKVTMA